MRLTPDEISAIKAAAAAFRPSTVVRLFGSRLDDNARGGDIDLHLEVDEGEQTIENIAGFRYCLPRRMAERKIDLVFHVRGRPLRPIDRVAYAQGVIL